METRQLVVVAALTEDCCKSAIADEAGLTQKALAERMNCTQQYVSKILKGKENMSLDTLTKLEDALGICIIYDEQVAQPNMVTEEVFA